MLLGFQDEKSDLMLQDKVYGTRQDCKINSKLHYVNHSQIVFTLIMYLRNEQINKLGFILIRFFVMRTLKNCVANKLCESTLKVVRFSCFSVFSFDANVPLLSAAEKADSTQTNKKM